MFKISLLRIVLNQMIEVEYEHIRKFVHITHTREPFSEIFAGEDNSKRKLK